MTVPLAVAAAASILFGASPGPAAGRAACPVTIPTRTTPAEPGYGPAWFNHGGRALRAQLYWPNGTLSAGILPGGGSMATVERDGSISLKLGWWRGVRGRLAIRGRRLDAHAPPLRAHVPGGYGARGFQPSGITFPTTGCWRVTGSVGEQRLAFVLRVRKLPRPR